MAFSKKRLYNKEAQLTSAYASAIDHPARQQILIRLCIHGPCTVDELRKGHPISKSTMSEHLEKLRIMGLISCKERFPHTIYFAEKEGIVKAEKFIIAFFRKLNIPNDEDKPQKTAE